MKHKNAFQITTAINTAANLAAKDLSDDELNFFAAAFMQLADVLATISAVRALNAGADDDKTNPQEQPPSPEQTASAHKAP
jgi:hypothetical protein